MNAPARISTLSHDGLTFGVLDSGPLDGTPVVLLHGFPQRASSWAAVSRVLNDAGLRTYALDQRGYSPGARPPRVRDHTVARLVGDVLALIERIGTPVHVVGHDWGANIAWALSASHPEHIVSLTALSVPHPRALSAAMRHRDQARRSWYIAAFQLPWLPERMLASRRGVAAMRSAGMDEDMLATYRSDIVEAGALPGGLNWYRALRVRDKGGFGRTVRVPTTYVWSDGDTALGREGAEGCGQFVEADYRYIIIEGASHWIVDQRPDEVADAVLERVRRP